MCAVPLTDHKVLYEWAYLIYYEVLSEGGNATWHQGRSFEGSIPGLKTIWYHLRRFIMNLWSYSWPTLSLANETPKLVKMMERRKDWWTGYIVWHESLLQTDLQTRMEGKRKGPRTTVDNTKNGPMQAEMKRTAEDTKHMVWGTLREMLGKTSVLQFNFGWFWPYTYPIGHHFSPYSLNIFHNIREFYQKSCFTLKKRKILVYPI